jgi:hypothetical protein
VEIRSKRQFFSLWEAGVLGNRTRLWRDPLEAFEWGRDNSSFRAWKTGNWNHSDLPEIGFREIRSGVGAGKWEKVPWHRVLNTAERWTAEGRQFIMDDGAPDDKRTLCGEVCRTYRGWEGILGVVQMPMREAMKRGLLLPRTGATVLALLDRYMDPSSRDDLDALLELYPDATIEFSCFTVDVGVFPGRNTIFWEVRNY